MAAGRSLVEAGRFLRCAHHPLSFFHTDSTTPTTSTASPTKSVSLTAASGISPIAAHKSDSPRFVGNCGGATFNVGSSW